MRRGRRRAAETPLSARAASTAGLRSPPWAVVALVALGAAACGDDDDDGPAADAGPEDAGPWQTGVLTCANDVISDYATREYTFGDPFERQDLGPNWHTDAGDAWQVAGESRLEVTGAGGGPGPLAMVGDGQQGTDIVGWFDVQREEGWAGGPSVVCRADGPPMTQGYGVRLLATEVELFEQAGAGVASSETGADLAPPLADAAAVRVVLGCNGDTVTAFLFALDEAGQVGDELACVSWRHEDAPRAGAFALTHAEGTTGFDNARMVLDPP
jgi:hypothetical protein